MNAEHASQLSTLRKLQSDLRVCHRVWSFDGHLAEGMLLSQAADDVKEAIERMENRINSREKNQIKLDLGSTAES